LQFIEACSHNIDKQHRYLLNRGMSLAVLEEHQIGYNPVAREAMWGDQAVFLPSGIVLPWSFRGVWWRVNIRRFVGETKYIQPKGCANGLYRADHLHTNCVAVLCEGEFDALSIVAGAPNAVSRHGLVPVATGSTEGGRLTEWVANIAKASTVLVAFDNDAAGEKAAHWWQERFPNARRLKPLRHDVNEMLIKEDDLEGWLSAAL
jgi:hypothetical protein